MKPIEQAIGRHRQASTLADGQTRDWLFEWTRSALSRIYSWTGQSLILSCLRASPVIRRARLLRCLCKRALACDKEAHARKTMAFCACKRRRRRLALLQIVKWVVVMASATEGSQLEMTKLPLRLRCAAALAPRGERRTRATLQSGAGVGATGSARRRLLKWRRHG